MRDFIKKSFSTLWGTVGVRKRTVFLMQVCFGKLLSFVVRCFYSWYGDGASYCSID
jgi:hypothetical protein